MLHGGRLGIVQRCLTATGTAALFLAIWLWAVPAGAAPGKKDVALEKIPSGSQATGSGISRQIFINEIHYDNLGEDTAEGVEIAGPSGTGLEGWALALYNGNGGEVYRTVALSGTLPYLAGGVGCRFFPIAGLQNGAPDGIALVNPKGTVVQFIGYEGVLAGANGPAGGYLSVEIGVEENGGDPPGLSLQLKGTGEFAQDFAWSSPDQATPGAANRGQTFLPSGPVEAPQIEVIAPAYVAPGGLITYTLIVQNRLGFPLHSLQIADPVPAGTRFAHALDGGALADDHVVWEAGLLPDGASLEVRFAAFAPGDPAGLLVNEGYTVIAQEWSAPVIGEPAYTVVGNYTPIPAIQGSGFRSPMAGKPAITRGVVTGLIAGNYPDGKYFNGFYLQDRAGDGNEATSDALFIHSGTQNLAVKIGEWVEVSGMVQEFDEYNGSACRGEACLTQVSVSGSAGVKVLGEARVTAIWLDPPGEPQQAAAYFEAREGMQVELPGQARVVEPTGYGTIQVIPEEGIERVLRGGAREGKTFGVRHWERSGDIGGANAPGLITGSRVGNISGPLAFSYGDYLVVTQAGDAWEVIESRPTPESPPAWPAPGEGQFSAATLNVDHLDGRGVQFTKVISAVDQMGGPTFLALQEVRTPAVITGLVGSLAALGYNYEAASSHADAGGHGIVLLWRAGRVTGARWSTGYQACSVHGSPSSTFDPLWETCRSRGQYPLFARRPVVVTGTLPLSEGNLQVVVIANHFKSRMEGESAEVRRLEEAGFVADLAARLVENGSRNVIVLGDLNDFEDSPPLQVLYEQAGLSNPWFRIPAENRYSFIYQGVSQILDHLLITSGLNERLVVFAPLHLNSDFPYQPYGLDDDCIWRASDHDPVAATFRLSPGWRLFLPVLSAPGR